MVVQRTRLDQLLDPGIEAGNAAAPGRKGLCHAGAVCLPDAGPLFQPAFPIGAPEDLLYEAICVASIMRGQHGAEGFGLR